MNPQLPETPGAQRARIARGVRQLAERLLARQQWLATAESCTGGGIAAACTDLAGSSGWFERAVVSYSNRAKVELLGVDEALIAAEGAVSEAVVRVMAEGLRERAPVDWTVAVSGIAGPGGAAPGKPVGTVCFAWAGPSAGGVTTCHFDGDRASVRRQTVLWAVEGLLARL